jgi:signal transduction histidine kinase
MLPLFGLRGLRLYYLLATFDVLAVSLGLYLTHCIMSIYTHSVATNQFWVEIQSGYSEVDQLATALNAPGNDVFDSLAVQREMTRMHEALQTVEGRLGQLREALLLAPEHATQLLETLAVVEHAIADLAHEAELIFLELDQKHTEQAARHMARMDRHHGRVNATLDLLREQTSTIQRHGFQTETAAAASVHRLEILLGVSILVMVLGATFYGRSLASQMAADQRTRQALADRQMDAEIRARLLDQVMQAQEAERRRIARDLHDEVGQSLRTIIVGLRRLESEDGPAGSGAKDLGAATRRVLGEVRRLASGLRPVALDDLGLVPALERFARDYADSNGIQVEIALAPLEECVLPDDIATALYRIVQEAMGNVAQHALARHINLRAAHFGDAVEMTIEDDGCGFDPAQWTSFADKDHLGIVGMRERAWLLNGSVDIGSSPGQGTCVRVRLPLEKKSNGQNAHYAGR